MKTDPVIIKQSNIHNKGIFAAKDFKKGEIVLQWNISKTITKNEYEKLPIEKKNYICITKNKYVIMQEPEKYMNHSCEANTIVTNFCDIATRNIKKGEEITTDYFNDPSERDMHCNCGSKKCKNIIRKK